MPMLSIPVAQMCSSRGPLGPFGPELAPAVERAMSKFDTTGIVKLLGLFFEIIDKDGSKSLERAEVKDFWDMAGGAMSGGGMNPIVDLMFAIFDRNKNGKIS